MTPAEIAQRLAAAAPAVAAARQAALRAGAERILATIHAAIGTMDGPADGQGWASLAEATLDAKGRRGQLGRVSAEDILLATGAFRDSWQIDDSDPEAPRVFSSSPYAQDLEAGTRDMPARPLLSRARAMHGAQIAEDVRVAVARAIDAALAGHG